MYKLEYLPLTPGYNWIITRKFNDRKTLQQYMRRNNIICYKLYLKDEPIYRLQTAKGLTEISLKDAMFIAQHLSKTLFQLREELRQKMDDNAPAHEAVTTSHLQ